MSDQRQTQRQKAFGQRLRAARKKRGWSQSRLAEEVNRLLGDAADQTSQKSVSQWEQGQHVARREKLAALERLLDLQRGTFAAILEDAPEPEQKPDPTEEFQAEVMQILRGLQSAVVAQQGVLDRLARDVQSTETRGAGRRAPSAEQ